MELSCKEEKAREEQARVFRPLSRHIHREKHTSWHSVRSRRKPRDNPWARGTLQLWVQSGRCRKSKHQQWSYISSDTKVLGCWWLWTTASQKGVCIRITWRPCPKHRFLGLSSRVSDLVGPCKMGPKFLGGTDITGWGLDFEKHYSRPIQRWYVHLPHQTHTQDLDGP